MPADRATRIERLTQHARDRHEQTLQRAQSALNTMVNTGEPITVARLAAAAAVSRSWIYTQPELRDSIEQARHRTPSTSRPDPTGRASAESLRSRLALAHQRIGQLRQENQQLRDSLARAHGHLRATPSSNLKNDPDGHRHGHPSTTSLPHVDDLRGSPE